MSTAVVRRSRRVARRRRLSFHSGDHRALRDPARRDRRRARRARRARQVAHRLGQDARLRDPDRRAHRRRRPAPDGARARSDPRARHPDRRGDPRRSHTRAPCASPPSTAASVSSSRPRRPRRSHVLVATPGRLEDLLARGAFSARPDPDARPRRGRPDARHGLSPGDRPDRRRVPGVPPDALLLRHPRRRGRQARRTLHPRSRHAPVRPGERRANAEIEHRFVQVAHEHRVEALVGELRRDRDLTLVFVRTKRGADRLVKRLAAHGVKALAMHGNKSQRQREQALARFESGAVDTLVATDVAARGIDVERDLARHQLRPARRQRDLRPPHRPHRPRRPDRHRHHAALARPAR